jgi:hypothetical protein
MTDEPITADQIYKAYPRKVGRPVAIKAIEKAMAKIPPAELLAAVEAYAKTRQNEDPKFTPHPSTWFNQERWSDDDGAKDWQPANRAEARIDRAREVLNSFVSEGTGGRQEGIRQGYRRLGFNEADGGVQQD